MNENLPRVGIAGDHPSPFQPPSKSRNVIGLRLRSCRFTRGFSRSRRSPCNGRADSFVPVKSLCRRFKFRSGLRRRIDLRLKTAGFPDGGVSLAGSHVDAHGFTDSFGTGVNIACDISGSARSVLGYLVDCLVNLECDRIVDGLGQDFERGDKLWVSIRNETDDTRGQLACNQFMEVRQNVSCRRTACQVAEAGAVIADGIAGRFDFLIRGVGRGILAVRGRGLRNRRPGQP